MSEPEQKSEPKQKESNQKEPKKSNNVIIRGYPKTIYLWPSMVAGFVILLIDFALRSIGHYPQNLIINGVATHGLDKYNAYLASIWLLILFFNLIVISFDFSLGKTFTIFVTIVVVVLLYILVKNALNLNVGPLPDFKDILASFDIIASANFYTSISILLLILFLALFIEARFNFWEFESNRIIHHKGIFQRDESFNTQNSRVITSTDDIFELILFRAGTIHIIDPEKKLHVIENVYNATHKDKKIQDLLSVVRVRTDT